jgi:hypothetical protein
MNQAFESQDMPRYVVTSACMRCWRDCTRVCHDCVSIIRVCNLGRSLSSDYPLCTECSLNMLSLVKPTAEPLFIKSVGDRLN